MKYLILNVSESTALRVTMSLCAFIAIVHYVAFSQGRDLKGVNDGPDLVKGAQPVDNSSDAVSLDAMLSVSPVVARGRVIDVVHFDNPEWDPEIRIEERHVPWTRQMPKQLSVGVFSIMELLKGKVAEKTLYFANDPLVGTDTLALDVGVEYLAGFEAAPHKFEELTATSEQTGELHSTRQLYVVVGGGRGAMRVVSEASGRMLWIRSDVLFGTHPKVLEGEDLELGVPESVVTRRLQALREGGRVALEVPVRGAPSRIPIHPRSGLPAVAAVFSLPRR